MSSAKPHPRSGSTARQRAATVRRLQRSAGELSATAIARMDEQLPWYRAMPAEHRSWVGLVIQSGIAAFTEWYRHPNEPREVSADVFGNAPRRAARAVTLQQTVEMVRLTVSVLEEHIDDLAAAGDEATLREGALRYSREIAFAAAQVYAQAAEARGAWDARLEALVVDALLRGEADEAVRSRAAALGWNSQDSVVVVAGNAPGHHPDMVVDGIRRAGRHAGLNVLTGVQGERLVAILGGTADPLGAATCLVGEFGAGPVVVGPPAVDLLAAARSAHSAIAGQRAVAAWPNAPRPVLADDLLPERVLAGDAVARDKLVEEVYRPLLAAGAPLLETLSIYLEQAASLEASARMLYVHPNTVRYRLRRIGEITGYAPTRMRAAYTLQTALVVGRLADHSSDL